MTGMREPGAPGQVGIGLAGRFNAAEYTQIATVAEAAGFDAITVFGDLMFQPPAMVLATMAACTNRIRLGVAAYSPWTHHPVEIAGQVAYLDMASQGRAFYGLVRGAWLDQLGIDQGKSLSAIADTAEIVTRLLAGDASGYVGSVHSLGEGLRLEYEPFRPKVPLLIGTWSAKLAAYAATVADEIQAGGSANPAMVGRLRSLVADAGSGREVGICLNAVVVVDDDPKAAALAVRAACAPYFDVVASLDATLEVDPDLLKGVKERLAAGDHEGAGGLIPDELLRRFAFWGTADEVANHAMEILEAGALRVEFDTPFGLSTPDGLRRLATDVLPRIRAMQG
jgi:5,10-methylenetetrahydromethanopterin reductase